MKKGGTWLPSYMGGMFVSHERMFFPFRPSPTSPVLVLAFITRHEQNKRKTSEEDTYSEAPRKKNNKGKEVLIYPSGAFFMLVCTCVCECVCFFLLFVQMTSFFHPENH